MKWKIRKSTPCHQIERRVDAWNEASSSWDSWGHQQSVNSFHGSHIVFTSLGSKVAFEYSWNLGFIPFRILQSHLGSWLVEVVHRTDWNCQVHGVYIDYRGLHRAFLVLSSGTISSCRILRRWFFGDFEWSTELCFLFSDSTSIFEGEFLHWWPDLITHFAGTGKCSV